MLFVIIDVDVFKRCLVQGLARFRRYYFSVVVFKYVGFIASFDLVSPEVDQNWFPNTKEVLLCSVH